MSVQSQSIAAAAAARGAAPPGVSTPPDWVSHIMRHLERWVAWSIAVYTAWLAVFAFPGVPAVWLFVLYAGLIGKWAQARPARHQCEMSWRAAALLAGAYVLNTHISPQLGGPLGPFFFWLSMTCLYYAFMLKPAWGAGVIGLALVAFTASLLQATSLASGSDFMVRAGYLCIFPLLLAMRFGAAMRASDEILESGRIDASTSLYNNAGLAAHGDELLAACRREKRPLSVAVFDCADLLEVREIYGSRTARKLTDRIVRKLTRLSARRGLVARTGPAEFTVVLPGLDREQALAAIARVLGRPMGIELDAGDSEIVMVPGFLVETAGPGVSGVSQLHEQLRGDLAKIEDREQRRQDYLQRERERHSRPMGMVNLPGERRRGGRRARVQVMSTLPAPLVVN